MKKFSELKDRIKRTKAQSETEITGVEKDLIAFINEASFTGRELLKEARSHRRENGGDRECTLYEPPEVREILERILRKREDS